MALNYIFSCPAVAEPAINGEDECQVTDELIISGTVDNAAAGGILLQGKLRNTSTYMEYKNVLVQAELCDSNGNTVGVQTITVEDDVEKGETEQFEMNVQPLSNVSSVDYKIICAERDFAGLGY